MVQHHQQQSPRAQVNNCTLFWQLGFRLGFKLAWLAVYRYKANETVIVDVSGGPASGSDVSSQGGHSPGYWVKSLLMPCEEDDDTPAAKKRPMQKRPRCNEDDHTEDHQEETTEKGPPKHQGPAPRNQPIPPRSACPAPSWGALQQTP